jgi:hypothetical protein
MRHLLLLFFTGILFAACKHTPVNTQTGNAAAGIPDTAVSASCPFLTTNNKGNLVLSWVKGINDSVSVMCFAVSPDKGKTFSAAIEILSSKNVHPHAENMPKLIFKPNGEIIALWGAHHPNPANKYSGLVFYAQSFDEGKTWSDAKKLVPDTASIDQRYFDVALLSNGEAGITWLDNRSKTNKEGSTLYFAVTNGKNGFENEMSIGETCCQCCRTDLFVDSKNNIHVAYRDIIDDSIRDMVHVVSSDGGKTFSIPERISADNWVIDGCPHSGPAMAENKNGLQFAWYTMGNGKGVFYCHSADNGKTFSSPDSVSGRASAKHPQLATLDNGDVVIAWDESAGGEKHIARIGLQRRTANGEKISRQYITTEDAASEFPVIKAIDSKTVFVAYSTGSGKKKKVRYQLINL